MSDTKFKKQKEDFTCQYCRAEIKGSGYTNHCPQCLYSKHVDIFPGDRSEDCGGLMEPVGAKESGGEWSLVHKCLKCGKERKNKVSKYDNFDAVIATSRKTLQNPQ